MMLSENSENAKHLDELFRSYREITEPSDAFALHPNFMPELWQRIESRRSNSFLVERLARVFATAAVAVAVCAGLVATFIPQGPLDDTWVEALANHHLAQNAGYYEPVRLSPAADSSRAGGR